VRRVAGTALVCVGSRRYFSANGTPLEPADLASHNCLVYHGLASWPFSGPDGRREIPVRGTLSSNSIETILSAVRAGMGIGMVTRASLERVGQDAELVAVLEAFVDEPRDINLVWPKRRFVPARVRNVTAFLTQALGQGF
jgi:DNA-binding transcriptional LysR family regulator